jgi:tRNA modification GTPase
MTNKNETIFAVSTPPGKSAIAVIRVSGDLSYKYVKSISKNMPKQQNIATLNELITHKGEKIDQTITTFFKGPKSFTGEDMVELSIHGGGAVIKKILDVFSKKKNMRFASPGEFTRRAFENNKLDLTQVEAIADIVSAETEMQRKQAISNLSGAFFDLSKEIFENLKKTLANIEAVIDFSEEDLPENLITKIREQIENNIKKIEKILENSKTGISIRDGFVIGILGKPNTGKSSFINNVSKKDVSIVTDQPGTTRDLIESFIDILGYPVKLVDTAGIRDSLNLVEKIGVEKALLISQESDLNIVFIENIDDINYFKKTRNCIFVRSKQDVFGGSFKDFGFYNISSKSSFGINDLLTLIVDIIAKKEPNEKQYISRERHAQCLSSVVMHLKKATEDKNFDLIAEDLRQALKNLTNLFGNVDIEDILDIVFSDFCIGK